MSCRVNKNGPEMLVLSLWKALAKCGVSLEMAKIFLTCYKYSLRLSEKYFRGVLKTHLEIHSNKNSFLLSLRGFTSGTLSAEEARSINYQQKPS